MPIHAEVVATGSELVLGKIADTNSGYISTQLQTVGIPTYYTSTVGDDETRMTEVLRIALARSPLVFTTGGLGPTVDDITREAVAAATGRPLEFHAELLEQIETYFGRLGRPMSSNNRRQAFIPQGAIAVENPVGTAPSFIVESEHGAVISLPGVPREMTYLVEHAVLPYLRRRFEAGQVMRSLTLHTAGMGESVLDSLLGDEILRCANPVVGLNAKAGQVDVRLTATAADEDACRMLIDALAAQVRERLGPAVYGSDEQTLEGTLLLALASRGATLTTAESGTRAQLAGRLAQAQHAAGAYLGGRVAVAPGQLHADLKVPVAGDDETRARALAAALREVEGATHALVLLALRDPARLVMAYDAGQAAEARSLSYASTSPYMGDWGASHALDWLRRSLG